MEWDALSDQSIEIVGYSQYGGKDNDRKLDALIGVPLIVENVIMRAGDITPPGMKKPRDYASMEILVHPAYASRFPRSRVIVNDGSTGLYRQMVGALAVRGLVNLPDGLPEEGDANTTRYDVSFSAADGTPAKFTGVNVRCPEGLRKSEYPGPDGSPSVTWYFA